MSIKPILFKTDMVRGILEERKNATRRLVRFLPGENPKWTGYVKDGLMLYNRKNEPCCRKPLYQPGDILYVRETWCSGYDGETYFYLADKNTEREQSRLIDYDDLRWRPSIHMPKQAARIWLKVPDVRVERLHDMTLDDFLAEGVVLRPEAFNDPANAYLQAQDIFRNIWDSTIPKVKLSQNGWGANPWVWVIKFERCEKPEVDDA